MTRWTEIFYRAREIVLLQARNEECPAVGAKLLCFECCSFVIGEMAAGCPLQGNGVEFYLLLKAAIQQAPNAQEIVDCPLNFGGRCLACQLGGDQRVDFRMLRLFLPVMLEQAHKLRVQMLVGPHALQIVALRQPFEMQDEDGHGQLAI